MDGYHGDLDSTDPDFSLGRWLDWGHSLTRAVRDMVDLHNGVLTTIPTGHPDDRAMKLIIGDVPEFTATYRTCLACHLHAFLVKDDTRLVVVENLAARANDPGVSTYSSRTVTYQNEVCHLLRNDDCGVPRIETVLDEAGRAVIEVGILTLALGRSDFPPIADILTEQHVRIIVEETVGLFVSSLEEDTYLLWLKAPLE